MSPSSGPASNGAESLVDAIAATIGSRVLSGAIPRGSRLRQEAVAAEFGVSRTPVREALRKLQARGLVQMQANRGATVRGPSTREIREAYEVRAELEGLAAELAATRVGDDDLRRLHDAQTLFRRAVETFVAMRRGHGSTPVADDDGAWARANDLFHEAILDAAGNARLTATIAALHETFPRDLTWTALSRSSRLLEENVAQHEAVLVAIESGDADEARYLMRRHVRSAGELVTRHIEHEPLPDVAG